MTDNKKQVLMKLDQLDKELFLQAMKLNGDSSMQSAFEGFVSEYIYKARLIEVLYNNILKGESGEIDGGICISTLISDPNDPYYIEYEEPPFDYEVNMKYSMWSTIDGIVKVEYRVIGEDKVYTTMQRLNDYENMRNRIFEGCMGVDGFDRKKLVIVSNGEIMKASSGAVNKNK